MVINLATIDFCPSGGGQKPEEVLSETITTNGSYSYSPSEGSVFSEANISVSVPVPGEEVLSETITDNGSYSYSPSEGNMFSSVNVSVDVIPSTETLMPVLDQNGEYNFVPPVGLFYDGATITVAVPQKEEVICMETITENGEFHYNAPSGKVFGSVEIEVSVPNKKYIYEDGVVTGLSDLGWDDDDVSYFQDNVPHYSWENSKWVINQANKDLYGVVNDSNLSSYTSNSDMVFLPKFDTSQRFRWGSMFVNARYIKGIPVLDYSRVILDGYGADCDGMFYGCSSLETISPMPSNFRVTSCSDMFYGCSSLKKIPIFNTSECQSFQCMFQNCSSLKTIPGFDTSSGLYFTSMFSGCNSLVSVPPLDTSNSDSVDNMFDGCTSLREINGIDFSGVTETPSGFIGSDSTIGPNITKFIVNGKLNYSYFDFSGLTNIDYQSVKSILQAADNTDNVEDQKDLVFNITMTDQNNELAGLVSSASSKGWNITGLTLV